MAPGEKQPPLTNDELRAIRAGLRDREIAQANRAKLVLILGTLGTAGGVATAALTLWDKFRGP